MINARSDADAANRLAAYNSLSLSDKASVTKIPALTTWNASITVNPNLGKISALNLDYLLNQCLVEFPYEGRTSGGAQGVNRVVEVVLDSSFITTDVATPHPGFRALPFFRFTIAASGLEAKLGNNYTITLSGVDKFGTPINTVPYTFQRNSAQEAVYGVFVPFRQVATRVLPAMPVFGSTSAEDAKSCTIRFEGVGDNDLVFVTVPGYATNEMREISQMFGLPSGLVK